MPVPHGSSERVRILRYRVPMSECRACQVELGLPIGKLHNGRNFGCVHVLSLRLYSSFRTLLIVKDTAKVQAQLCGLPNTSKSDQVRNYSIVALSVATLFVALRLYGKISRNRFGLDDWIITFALCLTVLPAVCTIKSEYFSRHVSTV